MSDSAKTDKKKVAIKQAAKKFKASDNLGQINREFQEKSVMRLAKELNLSYVNLEKTPLNPDFLKLIPLETSKQARLVSFYLKGKKLKVAVEDHERAETLAVLEELRKQGYEPVISLASIAGMSYAIKHYENKDDFKKIDIVKTVDTAKIGTYEKEIANLASLGDKLEGVPAPEALNLVNLGAVKTGVSDVHYEPDAKSCTVRFRIDGVLHKVFEIKSKTYENLANQIKYQCKMQMNVYTIPQDGRYDFDFNEKKIAVRVSSIPTPYGESFVCRFLSGDNKNIGLEELGFQGTALKKLQNACAISQGMVLVTGPTGSGKSTTLYTLLGTMNTPENKVITLEDPVEYNIPGVTQSQIDEKHDYTFANGLRSILRQDPDIVMLGEIRDLPTAETAAQAALTGHVLLSTLHTNSAIETIPRLINIGLPPFMVAPALNTIVAQRLVRKVCKHCSKLELITDSEREEFEKVVEN
ncbi:type II/IV secretion system protein [Candidatus Gracilibacteria bacterium]|nr:type II/IV secretion system protein [Candidatus Gracilibacteria bacterium]